MVRFPRARYTERCSSTEKENKRGDLLLLVSGRNEKKKKKGKVRHASRWLNITWDLYVPRHQSDVTNEWLSSLLRLINGAGRYNAALIYGAINVTLPT